jgi:hypothetical protein
MFSTYKHPRARQSIQPTPKTALKKAFVLAKDTNEFPTLNDSLKTKTIKKVGTPISFSSALTKNRDNNEINIDEILTPGWCYIRRYNNMIQYKYGPNIFKKNNIEEENTKLGRILFKYKIAREQYDRDRDVEQLGDLSEFYGEPTLAEMYENDTELEHGIELENNPNENNPNENSESDTYDY